jgi:uncharacterized protein (TIGR00661 family)
MKILYGVVGEGMGHATRSRVILNHLVKDHEVEIVVSGRAHDYLSRYFFNVTEIKGLRMIYEDNEVDRGRTAWEFITNLPSMIANNFDEFIEMGQRFEPDVVISDFETFAYTFGKHHDVPVISIDNMQIINRCELEVEIPDDVMDDYLIAKTIVKGKLFDCYHYLITTFFYPPIRKEHTSLYPPILRNRILDADRTWGEHILVYQTTTTNERVLEVLGEVDMPFYVYGFGREDRMGNIMLRGFSEDGFIEDLASCRGVLATGGFSLMGEAVYLGKPVLAVPLRKQFEQLLNSLYLQKLGYGEYHDVLTPGCVRDFAGRLETYADNLQGHQQDGNQKILGALDRLLREVEGSD